MHSPNSAPLLPHSNKKCLDKFFFVALGVHLVAGTLWLRLWTPIKQRGFMFYAPAVWNTTILIEHGWAAAAENLSFRRAINSIPAPLCRAFLRFWRRLQMSRPTYLLRHIHHTTKLYIDSNSGMQFSFSDCTTIPGRLRGAKCLKRGAKLNTRRRPHSYRPRL